MSQANYIIICEWKTAVAATKDPLQKICHASSAAADLVKHIDSMHPGELTNADTQPISDLQHYLMDHMHSMSKEQVDTKVAEMFTLLDALEEKFEHEY